MRSFSFAEISEIVNGRLQGPPGRLVNQVIIDSRRFSDPAHAVFFAIHGDRNDGHNYVTELYDKGLRAFVLEELPGGKVPGDASVIIVKDSLGALQKLAAYNRSNYHGEVIAVTGSNGKTIIKEWLYQAMNNKKSVVRSPLSYNSQVGVPLSLFLLDDNYSTAIIEAGISLPGEMERLERMIVPETGIFSNIGQAHQENFRSADERVVEKMKLFTHCRRLIYRKDYKIIHKHAANLPAGVKRITWSTGEVADYMINVIKEGSTTRISSEGLCRCSFTIPFTDAASIENAIHVFVLLHTSGYEPADIAKAMARLEPVAMRLEIVGGINNCTLINDTYNSDLVSLSNALDVLNQQNQHRKKTLILSDIYQSGKPADKLYKEVSSLVGGKQIDRFIGIGKEISAHRDFFKGETSFYDDTEAFLNATVQPGFRNEAILLKGSRDFHFEMISRVLQEKAHRTVMEVDLNALVENFRYYKSVLPRQTRIMAMVKAFSYGSGGYEVANVLQYNHVDYLAVAFADEGVMLRKNGINIPVMVMNPEKNDYFIITEYNLEPEIYDFRVLNDFSRYLERNGLRNYPVHLKIDTGMHRLGFEEKDTGDLVRALEGDKLRVVSVFSHLAAADEPVNDAFTIGQIEKFRVISDRIEKETGQKFLRHILNSSGIERFPEYAFDMVRLGIGLYGVSSFRQDKLQEVSTFKTSIAQIRDVKEGDTVGYSRQGKVDGERRIATLPVGYADGVFRALGNGKGKFMVNGQPAPVIGNVCMDMTMIDITGIPAKENDTVIIFGKDNPVRNVANAAGTIPYEILTRISERVKRIYFRD